MVDDVKCQASCDETAGAVCIRIWCTDTLVNLSAESTCLAFPVPVCFGATHPACEPPGCFVYVRGATGVDEDRPGSLGAL